MTPATKRLILWGALIAFGLFAWGRIDGLLSSRQDRELDALFAQSREAIRHSHVAIDRERQKARQTAAVALGLSKAVGRGKGLADSLGKLGDTLNAKLKLVETAQDSLAVLTEALQVRHTEVSALRGALDSSMALAGVWEASSARWQALAEQADSVLTGADSTLVTLNDARECRMLNIRWAPKCLSRTVTAVLTASGSIVGTVLVLNAAN